MDNDVSNYCLKYKCGKCCERGWDIFVTDVDIKKWEENKPEVLNNVNIRIVDGTERRLLEKKQVCLPNGKIRKLCIYYDFDKKCLIHDVNPEICRKFSCLYHPYFIFKLFEEISDVLKETLIIK